MAVSNTIFNRFSPKSMRIIAASGLALAFITVAFILTTPSFWKGGVAEAESTDDLLKAYTAKDTDDDGLPDWQEALYGTDPNKADTDGDGMSDGEAARQGKLTPTALSSQLPQDQPLTDDDIPVPTAATGSITDQFSKVFLQEYITASNGQPMSEEAEQALIAKLIGQFSQQAAQALSSKYSLVSVHTNKNTNVLAYVGIVENILKANEVSDGGGDPIVLMQALLQNNDMSAQKKLVTLATSYGNIRDGLLKISVPPSLTNEHIELIRSFDSLAKATKMVSDYQKDPLGVMGALAIYQPSDVGVVDALNGIASQILQTGEPEPGMPGAYILSAVRLSQQQQ